MSDWRKVTMIALQDLSKKWSAIKQLVPGRDKVLREELLRQENHERCPFFFHLLFQFFLHLLFHLFPSSFSILSPSSFSSFLYFFLPFLKFFFFILLFHSFSSHYFVSSVFFISFLSPSSSSTPSQTTADFARRLHRRQRKQALGWKGR